MKHEARLAEQAVAVPLALAPWRPVEPAACARPSRVAEGEEERVLQRLV
jgi:hypothetical protein